MTPSAPALSQDERIQLLENYDLNHNLVRYAELLPGKSAFIDARTPGSHLKENYCIVGEGVAENPDQPVHILDDKGFNVGAAGQPVGIKNSLHSHTSAEIFIIFRGQFRLYWGNEGIEEAVLGPGDMISIPTNCFRGFEVVGNEYGFLFAFLGGDDSGGGVTWHPEVIREADSHGLILLENGSLVDTVAGHTMPEGVGKMPPLSEPEMAGFDNLTVTEMLTHVALQNDHTPTDKPFSHGSFKQYNLSGSSDNDYNFHIKSQDGLCVFAYEMEKGGTVPLHRRNEPEVLINYSGDTLLSLIEGECQREVLLTKGDTFNLPQGIAYSLRGLRGQSMVYSAVNGNSPAQAAVV
ncbi:MAG: cupin domain-containing protein [Pseudomonadales bacterium]